MDRDDRIEADAALGAHELGWLAEMIEASDAEHTFVWLHHPPGMPGSYGSEVLDAEVGELVARCPSIRGFAAGHIHSDPVLSIADRPVYVCPALTISFDFDEWTTLPPGYRRFAFHPDGGVESECHLLDDERWPRFDLPDPVIRHFKGELGWEELMAEISGAAPGRQRG